MKAENTYLIAMPVFGLRSSEDGKKLLNHSSIINYGEELDGGNVRFLTKSGVKTQGIHSFDGSIKLFKIEDICLENLMSNWKRINKTYKPVVLDETIDTHEVFENDFSPLKIMVERRENEIAIKPIFEKQW